MPRTARIVGLGYPHHVTQRGNNREQCFFDAEDFKKYLSLLKRYSLEKESVLLAYCLMSNHIHLLLKPMQENSLSKLMQGISLCYTQYFNGKYMRTGRLWECRYHSCVIDAEKYLWRVARYIERNPVRAKVVKKAEDYLYSSAKAHIMDEPNNMLQEPLFDRDNLSGYKAMMKDIDTKEDIEKIRGSLRLGKPMGDENFSKMFGSGITSRPKGRPRNNK